MADSWVPPKIEFMQAAHYSKGNRTSIKVIVIHTMEAPKKAGVHRNCASWFAGKQAPQASAHYCIGYAGIVQCVLDKDVAWHAPGVQSISLGLEHEGFAKQTPEEWADAYNEVLLENSAWLTATLCVKWGIPPKWLTSEELAKGEAGIVGHKTVNDAFNGGKGHYDPGPNFPSERYIEMVSAHIEQINQGVTQ